MEDLVKEKPVMKEKNIDYPSSDAPYHVYISKNHVK